MRKLNKIFRKDVAYDNIKSQQITNSASRFTLFIENTFLKKPQGDHIAPTPQSF